MFCLVSYLIMWLTFTAVSQLGQAEVKEKKNLVGNAFPLKHCTSLPGDFLAVAVIENLPLAPCMRMCVCMCVSLCVCVCLLHVFTLAGPLDFSCCWEFDHFNQQEDELISFFLITPPHTHKPPPTPPHPPSLLFHNEGPNLFSISSPVS